MALRWKIYWAFLASLGALLGVSPAPAATVSVETHEVLTPPNFFTGRPVLGDDGRSNVIVFSQEEPGRGFTGDIWFHRIDDHGAPIGGPVQVTDSLTTHDRNPDISGEFIVFDRATSTSLPVDSVVQLYRIVGQAQATVWALGGLGGGLGPLHPKTNGSFVVWRTDDKLFSVGTTFPEPPFFVRASGVTASASSMHDQGDRLLVYQGFDLLSGSGEALWADVPGSIILRVAHEDTLALFNPSTSGPWVTYYLRSPSRVNAFNVDTGETRTVSPDGVSAHSQRVDGDLIVFQGNTPEGTVDTYVHRLYSGETLRVTGRGSDELFPDVLRNIISYIRTPPSPYPGGEKTLVAARLEFRDLEIYIADDHDNRILRFTHDGCDGALTELVPAGVGGLGTPRDIVLMPPLHTQLLVTQASEILRFDAVTGDFIDLFVSEPGLTDTRGMTYGPDGNLYVVTGGRRTSSIQTADRIWRFHGNTGAPLDFLSDGVTAKPVIAVGPFDPPFGGARDLDFGPDDKLYVTMEIEGRILRCDVLSVNPSCENFIPNVSAPRELKWAGSHLFVISGGMLKEYDAEGQQVASIGEARLGLDRKGDDLIFGAPPAGFDRILHRYSVASNAFRDTFRLPQSELGSIAALAVKNATLGIGRVAVRAARDVEFRYHTNVQVKFSEVLQGGAVDLDVTPIPPSAPPSGFEPFGSYNNLSTDAVFAGDVTVCLPYEESQLPTSVTEEVLWIHRLDNGAWQPASQRSVDTENNEVCGDFPGLSWFGLNIGTAGNLDGDADVDRGDLTILLQDRGNSVQDSQCGAPCDLDGDGMITVLDARKLVLLCTRPQCATE